jgi:hypothetical protein
MLHLVRRWQRSGCEGQSQQHSVCEQKAVLTAGDGDERKQTVVLRAFEAWWVVKMENQIFKSSIMASLSYSESPHQQTIVSSRVLSFVSSLSSSFAV